MSERNEPNGDERMTEFAEIAVGMTILSLRRINIERHRLVEEVPALKPSVDAVLEQIEALAEPTSAVIGSTLVGLGDALSGERGEQLGEAGRMVAAMGPELLRLSGFTKRA